MNFTTFNQYDKRFSHITSRNDMRGVNFCPFFSLKTANEYMKNQLTTQTVHEENLTFAIDSHAGNHVGNTLDFESLISFTSLNKRDIIATSIELIRENIIGYDTILPNNTQIYAVIFLKNGKFFVVMHDDKNLFHLRDCHETVQYSDLSRNELIKHLNERYQFDREINFDGYKVEEFSNIEYIFIDKQFTSITDIEIKEQVVKQPIYDSTEDDRHEVYFATLPSGPENYDDYVINSDDEFDNEFDYENEEYYE